MLKAIAALESQRDGLRKNCDQSDPRVQRMLMNTTLEIIELRAKLKLCGRKISLEEFENTNEVEVDLTLAEFIDTMEV